MYNKIARDKNICGPRYDYILLLTVTKTESEKKKKKKKKAKQSKAKQNKTKQRDKNAHGIQSDAKNNGQESFWPHLIYYNYIGKKNICTKIMFGQKLHWNK